MQITYTRTSEHDFKVVVIENDKPFEMELSTLSKDYQSDHLCEAYRLLTQDFFNWHFLTQFCTMLVEDETTALLSYLTKYHPSCSMIKNG
jgi:hypothetical protein